jgi:hypothetical protein
LLKLIETIQNREWKAVENIESIPHFVWFFRILSDSFLSYAASRPWPPRCEWCLRLRQQKSCE